MYVVCQFDSCAHFKTKSIVIRFTVPSTNIHISEPPSRQPLMETSNMSVNQFKVISKISKKKPFPEKKVWTENVWKEWLSTQSLLYFWNLNISKTKNLNSRWFPWMRRGNSRIFWSECVETHKLMCEGGFCVTRLREYDGA